MKACTLAVILGLTLLLPDTARADDPPSAASMQEGRARFKRGVELFKDGDFRAALIEFNRAYEVAPNYKIQFNVAQTCLELQDYACALHAFENYLSAGEKDVPKDRRQLVEHEIDRLKKFVGVVLIASNKAGADVSIDDVVVGRTPLAAPITVGAGRHKITVSLPPHLPATRVVDVAGGDKLEVDVPLADPPAAVAATVPLPPADAAAPARDTPSSGAAPARTLAPSRTPFWIGLATTGMLAAGTAATGVLALSAQSSLQDATDRLGATTDEIDSARTKARTFATATDVLLVGSIVAATVTTVLFFATSPPSRSTGSARGLRWGAGAVGGAF